jgi:hypothetical protein
MRPSGFTVVFRKRRVREPLNIGYRAIRDPLLVALKAEKVFDSRSTFSERDRYDERGELYVVKAGSMSNTDMVLTRLRRHPDVGLLYVAPQRGVLARRARMFDDAGAASSGPSWREQIKLEQARELPQWKGGETVDVAVIDTGVDCDHSQLAHVPLHDHSLGKPSKRTDPTGHGSHVVGLVCATPDAANGFEGIATDCVNLEAHRGMFSVHDVASYYRALAAARTSEVRLLNLSLGGVDEDPTETEEIAAMLKDKKFVVVAAMGNSGDISDAPLYPAVCDGVIAVGSVKRDGMRADTSSFGAHILLAAPGVEIDSTVPTYRCPRIRPYGTPPLGLMSGTSMAAPIVSAVIARMLAFKSSLDRDQVIDLIKERLPGPFNEETGWGILDAHALLSAL